MKIIVSHDVDHLTASEHFRDSQIVRFFFRAFMERWARSISAREFVQRCRATFRNQWQNLEAQMSFDKKHDIPSTFFIAVNTGCHLRYKPSAAQPWMRRIRDQGFDIGVHGIAYRSMAEILREREMFKRLSGLDHFGIRIHYLRRKARTFDYLDEAGYLFDSTLEQLRAPFKHGALWEVPLHLMENRLFYHGSFYQNRSLEQARLQTMHLLKKLEERGFEYVTLLFHDRYFHEGFMSLKSWYVWVVSWCRDNGWEFTSFREAVQNLESITA